MPFVIAMMLGAGDAVAFSERLAQHPPVLAARLDKDDDDEDDRRRRKARQRKAPATTDAVGIDDDEKVISPRAELPVGGNPAHEEVVAPPLPASDGSAAALPPAAPGALPKSSEDAAPARVADRDDDDDGDDDDEPGAQPTTAIVVTARKLDAARTQIDAALGSTTYALSNETIENRPGGETGSLATVLAQAPGVTSTGSGLMVRGSPASQIRINNAILPEAISDPADHLSARFAETTRLLTGTLPAQFGFAPAGVISVTTKNGLYQHGGEAELFAGTNRMLEPALEWAGSVGGTSLFGSGNYERGRSTVADATGAAAHDDSDELEGLAFADHVIGASDRVSLLVGGTDQRDHIGATRLLPAGVEHTSDAYAVATYQHSGARYTVQASVFGGTGTDAARFTAPTREARATFGTQIDATASIGDAHTVRAGLLAGHATVHELELDGDKTKAAHTSIAVYAQDEWKITPTLTFNPGLRAEWLHGFGAAAALEPRASLVWQTPGGFSAHGGYSRFATAVPLGEAPVGAPLSYERDDYFDIGVQQRVGAVTLGLDAYRRSVRNFLSEHAAIGSTAPSAFAFARARFTGLELSTTFTRRGTSAWANLSLSRARGRMLLGAARLFPAATLIAAAADDVRLGSDRPFTLSAGVTQRVGKLSLSSDLQVSSGAVGSADPANPNRYRHSAYGLWGVAAVYHSRLIAPRTDFRIDATNLTDSRAVTSDATALEGGWTQRAPGRAVAIGVEQAF